MKKIVLTGGGTSGHITPNIAMLPELKKQGYDIYYIGSKNGMEKDLIEKENIPYYGIASGKLRRYFDWKNFSDLFKIGIGFIKSLYLMLKIRPHVVFSKGGFVSAPVVWAAWLMRRPVVIHESDMTPGLANKISQPFAKKICYAFPETEQYLPKEKSVWTGIPIRQDLFLGDKNKGLEICGFNGDKPVLTIMGGSLGSKAINDVIRLHLDQLLEDYQICHLCGKGHLDNTLLERKGYKQFEYVNEELLHVLKMTDVFVSRAGATTLFELSALKIPNLLIPLSKKASRGDQILNAASFEKQGFSIVLQEEDITDESFLKAMTELKGKSDSLKENMIKKDMGNAIEKIMVTLQFVEK
ncbi:MAG: undecaprenyldiphospho-muramoylpentapeptide beta-N-acetylglucosaminyltransferase [Clostridia bacterium]|nr:undecaprenyldiphospho-muramoylpentapeptide beta-N-acetylglucosaminyltransferase [Clostridia bacterium]